jgi:hypothetical protein
VKNGGKYELVDEVKKKFEREEINFKIDEVNKVNGKNNE